MPRSADPAPEAVETVAVALVDLGLPKKEATRIAGTAVRAHEAYRRRRHADYVQQWRQTKESAT